METNLRNSCSSSSSSSSSSSEDYINMEVDSSRSIFRHSSSAKEFEFQSFSSSSDRDHTTTSPADELFYMGKLLPLHLPPRLEMVHKILQNPPKNQPFYEEEEEETFNTPIFTPTSNTTPFESCNVSPAASCQVSRELDPQEYFVEYLAGIHQEKKSWTRKLRLIKQTRNIGSKLKSLFTKSSVGCSNEYSAHIAADHRQGVKQLCSNPNSKTVKREEKLAGDFRGGGGHRRSFSAAFKCLSKAKTLPQGVGYSSVDDMKRHGLMKRSCSSSTELESPIQAAIAHCKSSHHHQQQRLYSTTEVGADEIRFCPNSAHDDEERSWLWMMKKLCMISS